MTDEHGREGRALLTEGDREWLKGNVDSSSGNRKTNIRKRLVHLAHDLELLVDSDYTDVEDCDDPRELLTHFDASSAENFGANLIALAFATTNDHIDYTQLAGEIFDEHAEKGMLLDFPLDDILTFRRALYTGLRRGKTIFGDETPEQMLVAANTRLFKEPTDDRIKEGSLDGQVYPQVLRRVEYTATPPGFENQERPPSQEVPEFVRFQILVALDRHLTSRRASADPDLHLPSLP